MSYWNNSNGIPFQREYVYNPNAPSFIPPNANFNNASFSGRRNYFDTQHDYNNVTSNSSQQQQVATSYNMGEAAENVFYNNPDNKNVLLNVSHSNSNLTPTAKEFTPSGSQSRGISTSITTGAVRKKQYNKYKSKPRLFTSHHRITKNHMGMFRIQVNLVLIRINWDGHIELVETIVEMIVQIEQIILM